MYVFFILTQAITHTYVQLEPQTVIYSKIWRCLQIGFVHRMLDNDPDTIRRNRNRMSKLLKRIWGKPSIMIRTGSYLAPPKSSSSKRKRVTNVSPTRNVRPSTAPTAAAPSLHSVHPSQSNITSLSSDYVWEYKDGQRHSKDWKPYTIQDAMKLESTISANPKSKVDLIHPWATYEVQLPPTYPYGEQRNTSTGFRRRVRRREVKALQCPNCNKIFRSTCK